MFFDFFIYDYPLECMVTSSLNDYVINGFTYFEYQNTFFWDFLTINYEWEFPIDYTLFYDFEISDFDFIISEIYYEEYFFDALIMQTHKILDYHYDLVIFHNITNNNFYYLYISIYVNLLYLLMDFINYFYSYLFSIIIALSYINDNIFIIILVYIIDNINNYILWVINIFYDFLDHSTYKMTKIFYIYLIFFIFINILFL